MIKNKNLWLLTALSIVACALHAIMLHTPFNGYLYTSAFKVIAFVLFPIIYFKISKEGSIKGLISSFSIKNGDGRNIKIAFILGFCVFSFIAVAFMVLRPFIDEAMVAYALLENGITHNNAIFVFIYIVLINAALEQFFFRGFVFMSIYRMGFKGYAHGFSSLLFAVYHIPILYNALSLPMLILCTAGLVAAGLIFNFLTIKCKSISGALIVHISANLALNLMIGIYFVFT